MTGSELHGTVASLLPKGAAMRGFVHGVNRVLREVQSKGPWSWLLKEGAITTVAEYSTGTVSLTQGSATVTGSGTTFTSAMVGRRFRSSDGTQYTISAYVSGTQVTLSTAYAGSSVSGAAYRIYQDVYSLPSDCVVLQSWWNTQTRCWVRAVPRSSVFERSVLMDMRSGWPEVAAMWQGTQPTGSTPTSPQVVFWPAPSSVQLIPILYVRGISRLTGPASVLDVPAALELTVVEGVKWRMMEQVEGLEKGAREHQANAFRKMLQEDWSEDQGLTPSEIFVGGTEIGPEELAGMWPVEIR